MIDPAVVELRQKQTEQEVLAACMAFPQETINLARRLGFLAEHFRFRDHGMLWEALLRVGPLAGEPNLVRRELELMGTNLVQAAMIDAIAKSSPSAVHTEGFMKAIRADHARKQIAETTLVAHERAKEGQELGTIGKTLRRALDLVDAGGFLRTLRPMDSGIDDLLRDIEIGEFGKRLAVETGLPDLDAILFGLKRQQLIVLGARPSMGKTVLCLQIAGHAAMSQKKRVAFISLEMSQEQLQLRLLSAMTGTTMAQLEHNINVPWEKVGQARSRLREAAFMFYDQSLTVDQLVDLCRAHSAGEWKPDLVVVDYLGMIRSERGFENRTAEVSFASQAMKNLAKELDCAVLCAAQLNRQSELRSEKRPALSDLRDSGSIEQDADVVLLLHRDDYYEVTPDNQGLSELAVAKNRQGPTGRIFLEHKFETQKFLPTSRRTNK